MKHVIILAVFGLFLLTSCNLEASPSPAIPTSVATPTSPAAITPSPIPEGASPVLISELLAGMPGNNNYEFIELYNRSTEIIDLHGWSLWYRLPTSREDLFVYRWSTAALIPPQGHYLLSLTGQDIGVPVDAQYEQALNINGGGLQLRQTDGKVLDVLGWGDAQSGYFETNPAAAMQNGISLERLPGSVNGNAQDQDDNAVDFRLSTTPNPQNSGSPLTPLPAAYLELALQAPATAEPGSQFEYSVTITNHCGKNAEAVKLVLPIHPDLIVTTLPTGLIQEDTTIQGTLPSLGQDESQTIAIPIEVPWTYFTASVGSYYATAEGCPLPAFGKPVQTKIEGGVIPIGTARTLIGADLTIEGIATAYTGAYYAGTGNVKFYLQDDTGAIQVQVFEGQGSVNVKIGSRVRVRGNVSIYRGSTQIVPIIVPDDVKILQPPGDSHPPSLPASITDASTDLNELPGKLVQVQGIVTRVAEFSYSYELDLADTQDLSQQLTLYIDKQTGIQVEQIETGEQYIASGILDIRDTRHLLYPRIQDDLQRIYPLAPRVEAEGPALVNTGAPITYTLTAYNHTSSALTNPVLHATLPAGTELLNSQPDGTLAGNVLTWPLPEIPPSGGSQKVQFTVELSDSSIEQVALSNIVLTSNDWPEAVNGPIVRTFTTGKVPIWAIQGDGFRSPYLFSTVTAQGIVTGYFPDLSGFFIQETNSDEDPLTSPGIFVATGLAEVKVNNGDLVQVTGQVRELSGQTALQILGTVSINTLSTGQPLPNPVELDPPQSLYEAQVYYEALEGAIVQVSGPAIAVSPTSKYGEYVIVLPKHGVERLFQGQDNGIAIMVDDGSDVTHSDNSSMPYTVVTGDTIQKLIGPLAYTYERYKIEPLSAPQVERTGMQPVVLQPTSEGEFSLMTWNVENLFDSMDPNPSDPPKPLPSEYRIDLDKVASTIIATGAPSVVALQEIENLGVLEDLSDHPLLNGYDYKPILIEGFDSRGIDVGYLVQRDSATILDVQQKDAPAGLFSRPPLLLKLEVNTGDSPVIVYLLNNHFASMSAGVDATEPQRIAQAAWNMQLVEEILSFEPEAYIAIVGDLNSFYESAPIQTLRAGGLVHVFELLTPEMRYTYIYQGDSQVLDHILITAAFVDLLERVEILHVNADFPLSPADDGTPWHKSDHDPVIVTFTIK